MPNESGFPPRFDVAGDPAPLRHTSGLLHDVTPKRPVRTLAEGDAMVRRSRATVRAIPVLEHEAAMDRLRSDGEILRCEQLMQHARYCVFVFGSNAEGLHVGGAARHAWKVYGAKLGVGEGRTGRCYALPTMARLGADPDMVAIGEAVARFLDHARAHPRTCFAVTRVGCGIAGLSDDTMAELFVDAPENCALPLDWCVDPDEEVAEYTEGRLG